MPARATWPHHDVERHAGRPAVTPARGAPTVTQFVTAVWFSTAVDVQSDPTLAFERLLGEHREFSARLEQLAGESNKSVLALESERDQLRRAVTEAQAAAAQFEEVRRGLENRLAEQGRELNDARQEIRGLLKSAESTRAAQQREQERLEQLLSDERQARRLQREAVTAQLATIERLVQEAATPLRREAAEGSSAETTRPAAAA